MTIFAYMKREVERYINKHKLLQKGDRVVVTLSGGADSVALLLLLKKLGYICYAMHCNFHLRGEESMRDEQFVRNLCQQEDISLKVIDFNTADYSKQQGISIEMAARELRYKAFEEYRIECSAEAIAVAHHRDDSAETMLLNLIRGTGIKGLHGIRPKNGHIVRPLLCVGKKDIVTFLEEENVAYVTDSTNLLTDYTRNKVRLELIPMMQQINPSILHTLADTAERIASAEEIYLKAINEATKRVKEGNRINILRLQEECAPTAILHEILLPLGFNASQISSIYECIDSVGGKQFTANGWKVIKDREYLIIEREREENFERCLLPMAGELKTPYGILKTTNEEYTGTIEKSRQCASLDADSLQPPLYVRKTKAGDRFFPFGMRGSKLVSDYLTDRKMNILQKERQLVITDRNDNIVWLVGERPAAPYCIGEKTKKLLCLKWQRSE